MSGEILTTIIAVLTIVGAISAQLVVMTRGQERLSADIAVVNERLSAEIKEVRAEFNAEFKAVRADIAAVDERLSAEIQEVRADIAMVSERLSHTDGLVEGLSRALLTARAA